MEGTIQPAAEQVAGRRGRPVAASGSDAHLGLGLGALAQDEGAGEGVDVLDPCAGAVRTTSRQAGRSPCPARAVGGGQDTEVLRVLVGQDDEPAGAARGRREVVDGVLHPLAPGQHDAGLGERVVRGDGEPFGGVGAVQADEHERGVPGRAGAEREAPVGLLEDEHVARRVAPSWWRQSWKGRCASSRRT